MPVTLPACLFYADAEQAETACCFEVTYESTGSLVVAYPAPVLNTIGVFTAARRIVGEADDSQSALDNVHLG